MPRPRIVFLAIFGVGAGLLGFGYYLQYVKGLEPCPLCVFQRVCFMLLGATALIAAVHNPATLGARLYAALASAFAIGGIVFAGRQVWLQHLPPDKVPACAFGLDYWLETLPPVEVIKKVFRGTGECAKVDWTFLNLSIAEWTLFWFALILTACLLVLRVRSLPER